MRLPDTAAARLEWADFDGQGVREAAIGALRYIPAYASEARIGRCIDNASLSHLGRMQVSGFI